MWRTTVHVQVARKPRQKRLMVRKLLPCSMASSRPPRGVEKAAARPAAVPMSTQSLCPASLAAGPAQPRGSFTPRAALMLLTSKRRVKYISEFTVGAVSLAATPTQYCYYP